MEADSLNSTIEASAKCTNVYVPRDLIVVTETAKKTNEPYNVTSMKQTDILNWKSVSRQLITNRHNTEQGTVSNWKAVKWLQYKKALLRSLNLKWS